MLWKQRVYSLSGSVYSPNHRWKQLSIGWRLRRRSILNSSKTVWIKKKGGTIMGYGGVWNNNGFTLLVVLFILLIIVGNSYPMGGGYGT
jgi:uncharacterized protein (TIGR01732 family)